MSANAIFHMIAGATQPVAPFSHAVDVDGFVFVTGQTPDTPEAKGVPPDGIAAQTRNVMADLETILRGLDLDLSHTIALRAYLTNFQRDDEGFNATYQTFFAPDRRPARTRIGVTGLAYDALVEVDLIARR